MNHFSKSLTAISIIFVLTSCHKESLKSEDNRTFQAREKVVPPCTMVLIPTQLRPKIGFLPDGMTPWGYGYYSNLIHGVTNGANTAYQVYNPNLYAGLPENISSVRLTGLAVDRGANAYNPRLIFSYSNSSQHYLFFSDLDVNSNYPLNAQLVLSAAFAPANGGWKLHDIEYEHLTGRMYGIFYKNATTESIVAQINTTTGVCTSVKSFPGVRFLGMDFTVSTGNPAEQNKMYLLSDAIVSPGTYGVLYTLDLVSLVYSTSNMFIPTTAPSTGGGGTSFLARYSNSWDNFHVYGEGTEIENWNKVTNSIQSIITQKNSVTMPSTPGPLMNITYEVMTDAGN